MKNIVAQSTDISIIAQIITGAIGIDGLFTKLDPTHQILQSVLGLEMGVQVVELLYYIFLIRTAQLENMASIRYLDWVFTTPTMLITTIVYFTYEKYIEQFNSAKTEDEKLKYEKQLQNLKFFDFISENQNDVLSIVICNFFMLVFGYLGEIGYADAFVSALFGFAFFFMSFYTIYDKFAKFSIIGNKMFKLLFFVWSMYGFAFLLPPVYKNILFNTLDVIAKNFFGVYLYFKILKTRTK
jgi:hypothetical protein